MPWTPFPAAPHRTGVFRGPEEWVWLEELVLGRCVPFGMLGVVTGTGALDSWKPEDTDAWTLFPRGSDSVPPGCLPGR